MATPRPGDAMTSDPVTSKHKMNEPEASEPFQGRGLDLVLGLVPNHVIS